MVTHSDLEIPFAKKLFDAINCGIVVIDVDNREIVYVNSAALIMIGCRDDVLLGHPCTEYYCTQDPASCPLITNNMFLENYETSITRDDGTQLIINKTINTVLYGTKRYLVESFVDITKLKENDNRIHALLELSESRMKSEKDIARFALAKAIELTNSELGYLQLINDTTEKESNLNFFVWTSRNPNMQCSVKDVDYPINTSSMLADCIRTGKPIINNNYINEPNKKNLPEGRFELIRHLSVPVRNGNDEIVAVMGVANKETFYSDFDVEQLQLFANNAWQIIKRKRLDQALICSQNRYKTLVEKAPAAIYEIDFTDMRVITADGNISSMTGYTKEELLSMTGLDLLVPESQEKFKRRVKKALAGEEVPSEVEYTIKTKSGELRKGFLQINLRKRKEDGHIIAYVIASDITKLKELEYKARTYLELAPSVFVIFDKDANIVFINGYGMKVLECDETIIGKNWFDVFVLEKDKKRLFNIFSSLANGSNELLAHENEVVTYKNNLRVINWRNTVLKDTSGKIINIISAGHDVTEQKLLEKKLEAYWKKEEARLKDHLKSLSFKSQ